MKKTFKRAGVAVLSMAMLLSMGAVGLTANAEEGDKVDAKAQTTLTMNANTVTSGKYKVYKVATINNLGKWSWASGLNVNDSAIKNTSTGASFDISTGKFYNTTSQTYADAGTDAQKKALAAYLAQNLGTLAPINGAAGNNLGESITLLSGIDTSAHAYYLVVVTSDDAGVVVDPILQEIDTTRADTTDGTEINAKAGTLPFEKKITAITKEGSVATTNDTGIAEKGSKVTYTIKAQLPTYDSKVTVTTTTLNDFVIKDTPCEGLTIDTNSIKVYLSSDATLITDNEDPNKDTPWTNEIEYALGSVAAVSGTNSAGFTVTPKKAQVITHKAEYVFVQFDATVNDSAVVGEAGNPNVASLTYGNDYSTGGGDGKNDDEVTVYNARVIINKTGGTSATPLANAELDLYKATVSGATWTKGDKINTATLKTDATGQIIVEGLDEGDYIFEETKAPAGYSGVDDIKFHVSASKNGNDFNGKFSDTQNNFTYNASAIDKKGTADTNDDVTVNALEKIVNDPEAASLPGTGGMGTVLFTVGGAAIVLAAGAMFVVYMRKRKNEE